MKLSFVEALEEFLVARDQYNEAYRDDDTNSWQRFNALSKLDDAALRLEEAHKISLMDLIKGEE